MARIYAMVIIVIISFLACGYVYLRPTYSNMVTTPYQVPTTSIDIFDTKWEDFLADCGGEVIVENTREVSLTRNMKTTTLSGSAPSLKADLSHKMGLHSCSAVNMQ